LVVREFHMGESVDVAASVLAQALKLVKAMSDRDAKQLLGGESRLAIVPPGHRVMEFNAALDRAAKVLEQLGPEELQQLENRQAKVVVLRKGERVTRPFDSAEVAERVTKLTTEGEIVRYLDSDPALTAANLKKIATALNLALPATLKSKQAIQLYIAENVTRDRGRWRLP
jgi:hypothetical protein